MALQTIVESFTPNGRYFHRLTVTVLRQDVAANTSTLGFDYWVQSQVNAASGSWTTLGDTNFAARINGQEYLTSPNFDFRANRDLHAVHGEQTVTHNDDGTLTIPISFANTDNPGSGFFQGIERFGSMAINTIPRASKLNVVPKTIVAGGSVQITLDRSSGNFSHNLTWRSGSSSGTIANNVGTTIGWTPSASLLNGGQRAAITITAQTRMGGANVGAPVSTDIMMVTAPVYPQVGQGTPYDLRFRRMTLTDNGLVEKENIPFITATLTDTHSASLTCSLTVPSTAYTQDLDEAIVMADVYDGANWLDVGFVLVLSRAEEDLVDNSRVAKYTGIAYIDYLYSKNLTLDDIEWGNGNPGDMLEHYTIQGHQRGWGPRVGLSFSKNFTTIGTAWQGLSDRKIPKNTPVSQVLAGLVSDALCEYSTKYYAPDGTVRLNLTNIGYGADWTSAGADPIINFSTSAIAKVITASPVRKDFADKLTRVRVQGDEASLTRESATAVNPAFGHLEGAVSATGISTTDKLAELGDASLRLYETATVERTFTYDLSSTQTPSLLFPYRTFRPGDWVLVPTEDGPTRSRVAQVAITRDKDTTIATITTGDMIPNGVAAIARKQNQSSGGAISGGTLLTPLPLSSAIPAGPTGITTVADGFWDNTGAPKAGIFVNWNNVVRSMNDTNITVDLYEIWVRPEVGSPWKLALLSDISEGTIADLAINTPVDLRIRARSQAGIYGDWSDIVTVVTPAPDETLAAPPAPIVEVDALSTVAVTWGGLIGGVPAPRWFNYVRAEISDTEFGAYSVAGQQLFARGTIVVPKVGEGTWWFRLVGYDKLNVRGAASGATSILVVPLKVDKRKPKAPTNVVVTSTGAWNGARADSSLNVTWTAVTQAQEDNSAIDIRAYEVWAKLSTDTTYNWVGATASNNTSITITPVGPIGAIWDIQVTATATNNERGAPSAKKTVTLAGPAMAMDAPTRPTLSSFRGLVLVNWDGTFDPGTGAATYLAPAYVANIDIQVSTDNGVTWRVVGFLPRGARSQSVSGVPVGATALVRLVAYDILKQPSAPSITSPITVEGIAGDDLLANSVGANQIEAGSISVNHVTPSFGQDLNISANGTITLVAGLAADAQASADDAADGVAAMRTRYDFTPTEAVISQPGSPFQVAISNTQMEFRESGVARAFLNAGVFNAPRMASGELVLKYHIISDDPGNSGTVIRRR